MDVSPLLLELYGRIPPLARHAVDGVDLARLTEAPAPNANTIAWLIWHLARVQDHHIADILGTDQIWTGSDWARRFGLDPDPSNTGYGHSADDVASIRPEQPDVLLEYLDAVDNRTRALLPDLSPADLDRVVDRRWDPPSLSACDSSASPTTASNTSDKPPTSEDCSASETAVRSSRSHDLSPTAS